MKTTSKGSSSLSQDGRRCAHAYAKRLSDNRKTSATVVVSEPSQQAFHLIPELFAPFRQLQTLCKLCFILGPM